MDVRSTFFGPLGPVVASASGDTAIRLDDLVAEPLTPSQWRVCDNRLPADDANRLLGFIEVTKQLEFEVMSIVDGFEWFTYPTLAEATAHFAQKRWRTTRVEATRDSASEIATMPLIE